MALSQTISGNGAGTTWNIVGNGIRPVRGHLTIEGTFSSGTLIFESRSVGETNWSPVAGMSYTSEQGGTFEAFPGVEYRPNMSGSGTPDVDIVFTPAAS